MGIIRIFGKIVTHANPLQNYFKVFTILIFSQLNEVSVVRTKQQVAFGIDLGGI